MGMWSVSMLPLAHFTYEAGFTLALFMLAHTNSGFESGWGQCEHSNCTFLKRWSLYQYYQWTLMHLTLTSMLLFHWIVDTAAQHTWSGIIMMCTFGITRQSLLSGSMVSNDAEYFSPLAVLVGTQEPWKHDAPCFHFQWESWKHDGLPVVQRCKQMCACVTAHCTSRKKKTMYIFCIWCTPTIMCDNSLRLCVAWCNRKQIPALITVYLVQL